MAELADLLGGGGREQIHQPRDDAGPSGLVTRTQAGAVVAVEVLVEQEVITPVRVLLKFAGRSIERTPPVIVPQKDAGQPTRDFLGNLIQRHVPARARWTFDGEIIPVVAVILQEGPDDQAVDGHPDRSAPVGVAAEHAGIGLRRQVRHAVFPTPRGEHIGMLGVVAREGTDAVGAQELLLVEHLRQHPAEPGFVQDRSEPPARTPELDRIVDRGRQLRTRLEELPEPVAHLGILPLKFSLERRDRTQGKQADHGSHLQTLGAAVREAEHVVEETVFLVPHARVLAGVHHRGGDPQEMFDELETHLRIGWPVQRQLHGDLGHVHAEERHPGGAVGLFQIPAGR